MLTWEGGRGIQAHSNAPAELPQAGLGVEALLLAEFKGRTLLVPTTQPRAIGPARYHASGKRDSRGLLTHQPGRKFPCERFSRFPRSLRLGAAKGARVAVDRDGVARQSVRSRPVFLGEAGCLKY